LGPPAVRLARDRVGAGPAGRGGAGRRPRAGAAGPGLERPRLRVRRRVPFGRLHGVHQEVEMTRRTDVVLVYPQRAPRKGRHWIMPSLGLMYLSAALRQAGYTVRHVDHTFLERREVLAAIERLRPAVGGVYCM